MKNNLFNQALLKKYAKGKEFNLSVTKYDFLKEHALKVERGDFKSEVSSYLYFYDFLRKILEYKREENILFDEKEDKGRGKSEFALKLGDKKFMVIELKDQTTDLDKAQSRVGDRRTPVDQAFDYAQHSGDIDWIFVSNFKEFRLYNWTKKSDKYICFSYEDLLDKEMFKSFMLSFSRNSHLDKEYPEKLLQETLVVEKQLENNFYKLFHETRLMLIKELEEFNDLSRNEAVHYAQLILNRYMFVSFAEDTGLLPSQISTDTIVTPIKKGNLRHRSIWQRLNELFLDINDGNEYKKISAYNGSLFEEDLDFLTIRDTVEDHELFKDVWQEWDFDEYEKDILHLLEPHIDRVNPIYKNLLTISSFDFSSEMDVNILGHIFENSIGDLEELKEDVKGRRKKEGIFYTPSYITDYICRNTIIPYLSKSGKSNTVEELINEYWGSEIEKLDQKVGEIKIIDPACGSGAFLNKAADVLLEIHQAIYHELYRNKKSTLKPYFDAVGKRREILLENIYGVDLNQESVEITKLSLFLKVCKKDKKLPALDNNIKCGNSLIDDPEYTDKPFKWEEKFPEIFKNGGFDVVVGNPPYVRQEKIKEIKPYLKEHYEVYHGMADLYTYFFEKGLKILREGGFFSFIVANKFTRTKNDFRLRKFILEHKFLTYYDYSSENVFEEVTTNPSVIMIKNAFFDENNININDKFRIPQNKLDQGIWSFQDPKVFNLKDKIDSECIKLKEIHGIKIFRGVVTGFDRAFIINDNLRKVIISEDSNSKKIIKPLARGKDLKRYNLNYNNLYLIFTKRKIEINSYPAIKKYLSQFKERLTPRNEGQKIGRKPGDYKWYEIQDTTAYYKEFSKEKIVWGNLSIRSNFAYSNDDLFITAPANLLTGGNTKFIISILNSKLISFYFELIGAKVDSGYLEWKKNRVEQLPIYPATPEQQQPFIEKADQMLDLNRQLQEEVKGFHDWLQHTFNIEKLSKKLEKYYELELDDFLTEVRKKKVDMKSRRNYQTLKNEFEESLAITQPLLREIQETDDEIDQMVYELYGLNKEEIKIIDEIN